MKICETGFQGVFEIILEPIKDDRGLFVRSFCKNELSVCGLNREIVQINHSISNRKGTFRGLHYQKNPYSEIKIVRCLSGTVFDVIIDLRRNSETFLEVFSIELSAEKFNMLYIPKGFAHGFQTLTDDCQLLYLHSEFYNPESEAGLNYLDPILDLKLPVNVTEISERDRNFSFLSSDFKGI